MFKRALITNYYAEMGGGEFAMLRHAKWLLRNGVDVRTCLFHDGPLVARLEDAGAHVSVINTLLKCGPRRAWLTGLRVVPEIVRLIRGFRPDVVIDYTIHELPFIITATRWCGVPVVFIDQGTVWTDHSEADWREKQLPRWLRKDIMAAICTTRIKADDLIARGVPSNKVHLVYLGIDKTAFKMYSAEASSVRTELGISPECSVVGIFGRLIEWKGQAVFIRAISRLGRSDVHGIIVGGAQLNQVCGADYEKELRQIAIHEGVSDRIHFTGFRDDIPKLMHACDIICHASHREPFGLVIVEAMMAGKPVIASDVTGPREIVIEGETGFLTTPGDVEALTNRLEQLLNDDQLRVRLGDKGRDRAHTCFDLETNLARLNSVINKIICGN